ncbi:MAG: hypothetical protein ACLRNQ_21685 [Flavonifractor plautii]
MAWRTVTGCWQSSTAQCWPGQRSLLGAQFVTWARDYDRSGVNNGHYYMEDYQGAREDFALRSGLVARERVFDRERLEGLRQAVQGFLYGEGPASYQQEFQCSAPPGSDHSPAAGKNPGSDAERKSGAWTVHMRAVPNQAPLFSIQKLLVSLGLRRFFRYVW